MLMKHLRYPYLAPEGDDPAGSGGGGTGIKNPPADPKDPPADETFSKKDVDQREAKLRRRYDRELKEQKAELEELKQKLADRQNDPAPPPDPKVPDGDLAGRIELMEKRYDREKAEMQATIDKHETSARDEREKRLKIEKERQLDDALTSAGVDQKHWLAAQRYFKPQVEWDKLDNEWLYRTKAGNLVKIVDGVTEELPDIFKPSRMTNGGAGSSSGMPASKQRLHKELQDAETELTRLKDVAIKNGSRGQHMVAFRRQKTETERLRMAFATKK